MGRDRKVVLGASVYYYSMLPVWGRPCVSTGCCAGAVLSIGNAGRVLARV